MDSVISSYRTFLLSTTLRTAINTGSTIAVSLHDNPTAVSAAVYGRDCKEIEKSENNIGKM